MGYYEAGEGGLRRASITYADEMAADDAAAHAPGLLNA
jgi:hypothetical protein